LFAELRVAVKDRSVGFQQHEVIILSALLAKIVVYFFLRMLSYFTCVTRQSFSESSMQQKLFYVFFQKRAHHEVECNKSVL